MLKVSGAASAAPVHPNNEEVQEAWETDIPVYKEKADRNWKQIARKAPKELS